MAFQVPVPRSYQSIFGEISDTFRARYGISRLKIGGPFLRIFEAAAQSDLRCTQDVFNLLDLADFNRLSGSALDYKAAEEGLQRWGSQAALGTITFTDPRFRRLGTRIYSGSNPPVAGTTALLVADATLFATTGQIYVGRGTINAEGPLAYTSKTNLGQYWLLTLSAPTTKFHNVNEDVVFAQGGNRILPIGTTCSTAKDGRTAAIVYGTTQLSTILDGEIQVTGVPIVCRTPGRVGNTPTNTIVTVTSSPFPQVACTNPLPLVNARDAETDDELKERLRKARGSKARGTATAILFGVQGLTSAEDQKSVLSASLVQPAGEPATLFIDDGTGYEESTKGVPFEILMDSASGGEQFFALSGRRPISKAFLISSLTAPFSLQDGSQLAVLGGGELHTHIFDADDFTSISSATSQEVVSSINSDPNIGFSARTAAQGTKIAIFSRKDVNEDLAIVTPQGFTDANTFLGFSTTPAFTLRLYRNDVLLYKDGLAAVIVGAPQTAWASISDGVEFRIAVDGTPAQTYVINDEDFVNADTGYSTVSQTNSVASWAAVLNAMIPGVTAADGGGFLVISSNLGANSRASIAIESTGNPNLVQAGVFTSALGLSVLGVTSDFTLDRMTGEIKLARPLGVSETLTVGSNNTRAFLTSESHASSAVTLATNARLYVAVDAGAAAVATNVSGSTSFDVVAITADRTRYTASTATAFGTSTSLLQVGDFVVVWDPAFNENGVFRITELPAAAPFDNFIVERPQTASDIGVIPTNGGIKFFRLARGGIQTIRVSSGTNRSLTAISAEITAQLSNATASVYRNTRLRLRSNNFDADTSEIAVLTADQAGQQLAFPLADVNEATLPHRGSVVTAAEVGTPVFGTEDFVQSDATDLGPLAIGYTNIAAASVFDIWGNIAYNLRRQQAVGTQFFGALVDQSFPVAAYNATTQRLTLRHVEVPVVATSVIRTGGSTVTVTMPGPHRFCVGDFVWVGPQGTADANFVVGIKVVTAVPSTSTWRYTEAGANVTAAQPYVVNVWIGTLDSATAASGDLLVPCRPLAIGAYDTLNFTLNGDTLNQTYVVPMQRRIRPTSTSYAAGTAIDVVDSDNADNPLADTFGTTNSNFFEDFWVYQRARTVSHKVLSAGQYHQAILWRSERFGPEGNRYWLRYGNPTAPAQGISHSVDIATDLNMSTEPAVFFTVILPSGAARTGLTFSNAMMWTWAVSTVGVYKQVVISYSAPTIAIGGLTRAAGTVTATTSSAHGFSSGQIVYLTSSDANYPSGPKLITVTGGSTFTYSEAGTVVASLAASSVSAAPAPPDLTTIAAGDIVNIKAGGINLVEPKGQWQVYAKTATSFTIRVPVANAVATQTTPLTMGNAGNLEFYPINTAGSTATAIVAYAVANMEDLVLPTLIGLGDFSVTQSTQDEYFQAVVNTGYGSSVPAWQLSSGLSWVASSDLVTVPNTITLKAVANANPDIQSTADITNEEWRLVPVLSSGLARWFSSPAVTGAYATTDFDVVGSSLAVQASSRILGSVGGVQISGGLANSVQTGVLGGAERFLSSYGRLLIDSSLATGLHGDQYVVLANGLPTPKSIDFSGASLAVASDGTVTVSAGPNFWARTDWGASADKVGVHRVGNFAVYCLPAALVTPIADPRTYWFQCASPNASQVNQNIKRVVGFQNTASHRFIWVENPEAVNEVFTLSANNQLKLWTPDSVMPGDTLEIGFTFGGFTNNQGSFVVENFGATATEIIVNKAFTATGATALGTNASLVRITEPAFRLIERVRTVVANPLAPTSMYVLLAPSGSATQLTKLNPNLGSSLTVLDKLNMDTEPANGADGYSVTTGLIGEVVRVLYGDPNAPTLYPGIVAVGSTVYVAGPNAKRIRLSLQIRVRSGQPVQTIVDRVRAAIATEINRIPLATPVDLSRIVGAARKVQGVVSVVVLSPTYTSTQDVIPVQANEKPFVFDAQRDILLTPLSV